VGVGEVSTTTKGGLFKRYRLLFAMQRRLGDLFSESKRGGSGRGVSSRASILRAKKIKKKERELWEYLKLRRSCQNPEIGGEVS